MRRNDIRAIAIALLGLALMLPGMPLPGGVSGDAEAAGGSDLVPDEAPMWADEYDDSTKVYIPPGGLVGVELSGGAVQLIPGRAGGWIASEVITSPTGYRYDYIVLVAETPGDSRVEISILDATEEASQVGFANATIPNFVKVEGTDLSVYAIAPTTYPEVRIQVNLVAEGGDSPRLLSTTLYYIGLEEWFDDFLGDAKLKEHKGINFTDGALEVNLTKKGVAGGPGVYDDYPPIVFACSMADFQVAYPNSARSDYLGLSGISIDGYGYGLDIDDLNGDGYLDLVVATNVQKVHILWGDDTGSWSTTGKTDIDISAAYDIATGDFDGDGWVDIAVACYSSSLTVSSKIFLNKEDGEFNSVADTTFTDIESRDLVVGDLNGDGYDDLVLDQSTGVFIYEGSADGVDTTSDMVIANNPNDIHLEDLDGDGYLDLAMGDRNNGKSNIYMGTASGMDTTPDHQLAWTGTFCYGVNAGDFNGDGYKDIVYVGYNSGDFPVYIFEGTSNGWPDSKRHSGVIADYTYSVEMIDIDQDGKEEIVMGWYDTSATEYKWSYIKGATTWPTGFTKTWSGEYILDIAVAIPKNGGGARTYRGSLETNQISIGQDKKWDMLKLEGTLPQNTTAKVSILDGQGRPIMGYQGLESMNVDLSGITGTKTISVQVTLTSEFNWTTPVLDSLTVKWMDLRTWRDEFYGMAKIDSLLNMKVIDGALVASPPPADSIQMIFAEFDVPDQPGLLSTSVESGPSQGMSDPRMSLPKYMTAVDVADVNGDGLMDLAYARLWAGPNSYQTSSPLYLGYPAGYRATPDHEFDTTGAVDVLLEDLNGDGYTDVVFAQNRDGDFFAVQSTLFWGTATGWSSVPDVEFVTTGASGVDAADLDGDGDMDLVFSCYKGASTSTDSMVFLQESAGFCGTTPDHRLPTKGASGLAVGDIDGDGNNDIVFANSFSGGFAEIDSFVYWGQSGGGYETTPGTLPTVGASAVTMADLDDDGNLDVVFANAQDNNQDPYVDSFVYMGDGSRTLPDAPDHSLPTSGAAGLAIADLDGKGWLDVVFACAVNESVAYLSSGSGYDPASSMELPTKDARDVDLTPWLEDGHVAYMSETITLNPVQVGALHTLSYMVEMADTLEGTLSLIDADTWDPLASTDLMDGEHDWDVSEAFKLKEHGSFKVMVTLDGIQPGDQFSLYRVAFNWTDRVFMPPVVRDIHVSDDRVYRTQSSLITLDLFDEFDPEKDLRITVNSRLNGTEEWGYKTISKYSFDGEHWTVEIRPKVDAPLGMYDYRIRVRDSDDMLSEDFVFGGIVTVLNNLPTEPKVQLMPARPVANLDLQVELVTRSSDIESNALTYIYRWYRDGALVEELTSDSVPAEMLNKSENWSVEVSAFDGEEEGPRTKAWSLIHNAAPYVKHHMPDPDMMEDTSDSEWLNLTTAFGDPDGDSLTWSVGSVPQHLTVTIDHETGTVTIVPEADWNGAENVTFVASDGELQVSQEVEVIVHPVNDAPKYVAVDGNPIVSDPVTYSLQQGGLLVIDVTVLDVEGDELVFTVNTTAVELDDRTGEIRFSPSIDVIGTLRFGLKVYDLSSPDVKVPLNFSITVENENDPMDDP
ncbi:MAG: VCBS repeat-containing protein, partial [Thermoplasmata archaeon]